MINFLKNLFKKIPYIPHACEYKCVGYCEHFGQSIEINTAIENPSWHHYPSQNTLYNWRSKGLNIAQVFQSHWKCPCGKHKTFFFLANPKMNCGTRNDKISVKIYDEMKTFNPFVQNNSSGKSLEEVTNELINKFCY